MLALLLRFVINELAVCIEVLNARQCIEAALKCVIVMKRRINRSEISRPRMACIV